ncbi:hypothetical protein GCM10027290_54270 [Micromonospora sonneratiae]
MVPVPGGPTTALVCCRPPCVEEADQLLELLAVTPVDVTNMDIRMPPGLDGGLDTAQRIRAGCHHAGNATAACRGCPIWTFRMTASVGIDRSYGCCCADSACLPAELDL